MFLAYTFSRGKSLLEKVYEIFVANRISIRFLYSLFRPSKHIWNEINKSINKNTPPQIIARRTSPHGFKASRSCRICPFRFYLLLLLYCTVRLALRINFTTLSFSTLSGLSILTVKEFLLYLLLYLIRLRTDQGLADSLHTSTTSHRPRTSWFSPLRKIRTVSRTTLKTCNGIFQ